MPIYKSKSNKSNSKPNGRIRDPLQDSASKTDDENLAKNSKIKDGENSKEPMHPGIVKKFLLRNPKFLDTYVQSVELSRLRDWLENKERTMSTSGTGTSYSDSTAGCPNAALLSAFQRGQDAGRYLEPTCCTCTQLPVGPKARRPYIIYAVDANDPEGNFQHEFTVPRAMTNAEMGAFTRRYGVDLYRRMNMY